MLQKRGTQFTQFMAAHQQAHKTGSRGLNSRDWGRVLSWICIVGSLIFWIPASWIMAAPPIVQPDGSIVPGQITDLPTMFIATAFGVFLAVGTQVFVSIFVPGTRAGRLLLKLRILTPGKIVSAAIVIFLLKIGFDMMLSWWRARTAGAIGLDLQWAAIGVIFTMIALALLFEPVSRAELREDLAAEHEAQVYEIAAQARLNLMRKGQQEAEQLMSQGLHTLAPRQLQVVEGYIRAFAQAVDERHQAWLADSGRDAQLAAHYRGLGADPRTTNLLTFIGELARAQGIDVDGTREAIETFVRQGLAAEPGQLPDLPQPAIRPGGQRVDVPAPPTSPPSDEGADDGPLARAMRLSDADYELLSTAVHLMADLPCWTRAELQRRMEEANFQFGRSKASATIADWKTQGFVIDGETANTYQFTLGIKEST